VFRCPWNKLCFILPLFSKKAVVFFKNTALWLKPFKIVRTKAHTFL